MSFRRLEERADSPLCSRIEKSFYREESFRLVSPVRNRPSPSLVSKRQLTYGAFGVMLPPSRAFSNQLLHFCPGSHLQVLFNVEALRGVFSRPLRSDHEWGQKEKSPHSPFAHTPNFEWGLPVYKRNLWWWRSDSWRGSSLYGLSLIDGFQSPL